MSALLEQAERLKLARDAEGIRSQPLLVPQAVAVSQREVDVAATHADLAAKGVAFTSPPEKQFWGGSLAHFTDPAGNTLTLLG